MRQACRLDRIPAKPRCSPPCTKRCYLIPTLTQCSCASVQSPSAGTRSRTLSESWWDGGYWRARFEIPPSGESRLSTASHLQRPTTSATLSYGRHWESLLVAAWVGTSFTAQSSVAHPQGPAFAGGCRSLF